MIVYIQYVIVIYQLVIFIAWYMYNLKRLTHTSLPQSSLQQSSE